MSEEASRALVWSDLSGREREQVQLILFSLKEFSYGFARGHVVAGEVPPGAAALRFYMNALYQYCANYFLVGGTRKLRDVLRDLECGDLLVPVEALLSTTLGNTTFGDILKHYRDKFLVHQSFTFEPLAREVHAKVDIENPFVAGRFSELVNDLYAETEKIYVRLAERFPEAILGEDGAGGRGNVEEVQRRNAKALGLKEVSNVRTLAGRAEVHFHTQDEASLFLETNCDAADEMEVELQLFASFALRQMMNLGPNPITASLGSLLSAVNDEAMATLRGEGGPTLAVYPGDPGRKRFEVEVRLLDHAADTKFKAKGFGFLAQGMGYYAPTSVMALLKFLAQRRPEDERWQGVLRDVARATGLAVMANSVGIPNQHTMARQIVQAAMADVRRGV